MTFSNFKPPPTFPSHTFPVWALLLFVLFSSLQLIADNPQQTITMTVSQALTDLRSDLPEKRRGSVMLLAKYPQHPESLPAIVSALEDPDPVVRRAATVSLGENIRTLNPLQASRLIGALTDKDPEVRLSSSAWLPQLVLMTSASPVIRAPANPVSPVSPDRQAIIEGITAGLQDPQPIVRLKSLEALQYLRWPLDQALLLPLMGDPDSRVKLQAYQTLYSKLPPATYLATAFSHHPDPDPRIRLVLAEVLSRQPIPGSLPLLQELSEDPVVDIQIQAGVGLLMADPESGMSPALQSALMEEGLEASMIYRVFNAFNRLPPEERKELIEPLVVSSFATVRAQAVLRWLQFYPDEATDKFLKSVLNDPAPEVRQLGIRHLSSQPDPPGLSLLLSLSGNPFEDIRRQSLALSVKSTPEDQSTLSLRLLMDPLPDIRLEALSRIIQLRPENWARILRASLRDPAPEVRRACAQALLDNMGPEGQQIAADFARDYPDSDISQLIRMRLGHN